MQVDFGLFEINHLTRTCGLQRNRHRQGLRNSKSNVGDVHQVPGAPHSGTGQTANHEFNLRIIEAVGGHLPRQAKRMEVFVELVKPCLVLPALPMSNYGRRICLESPRIELGRCGHRVGP